MNGTNDADKLDAADEDEAMGQGICEEAQSI